MGLLLPFLIGVLAGLRSLTPAAIVAWAAKLGWMKLEAPFAWMGSSITVAIATVLAIVELVTDKLPSTPSRTAPPGLIARIVLGGLAGACVAMGGGQAYLGGAMAGIIGALVGTFGGYQVRTRTAKALGVPDIVIALVEDLITIGCSLWVVSRFS